MWISVDEGDLLCDLSDEQLEAELLRRRSGTRDGLGGNLMKVYEYVSSHPNVLPPEIARELGDCVGRIL